MLRWITAGESHGARLIGILEGLPAGLAVPAEVLDAQLARRQGGPGRGTRMKLEQDHVTVVGGIFRGKTTGAPVSLAVENASHVDPAKQPERLVPRPGHADLAGFLKYGTEDLNPVIERASARETAMRTALGTVGRIFLEACGARVVGYVAAIGGRCADLSQGPLPLVETGWGKVEDADELIRLRDASDLACPAGEESLARLRARIEEARQEGVTLGGVVEVVAVGIPPGLGSYTQWDRRLDGALGQAFLSIPSVKAVEIGDGITVASARGPEAHDEPFLDRGVIRRETNHAGGLEGGVTNGAPVRARVYLKPIPTQRAALRSFHLRSGERQPVPYIRSDTVVVPAASVIAESVASLVLAGAMREKFGGDAMEDVLHAIQAYRRRLPWRTGPAGLRPDPS